MLLAVIKSLRPRQWTKNLLLFAGVIFAGNLTDVHLLARAVAGFAIFCALSGVMYLLNDLRDRESDQLHPEKKDRPIASGRLPAGLALVIVFLLGAPAMGASFLLGLEFGITALVYVVLVTSYSLYLKHFVILDLMIVAMGFVLRAVAGIEVITVAGNVPRITPWFIACTLFLALFLAICKRRHEIMLLDDNATNHRRVLEEYSPAFLDQMVAVTTSATVISYALWSTIAELARFRMIYTLPFVLYGVFRYLYNVYRKEEGGAPEVILLKDRGLQVDILLWLVSVVVLLYFYKPK